MELCLLGVNMPATTLLAFIVNILIFIAIFYCAFRFYNWYKIKEFEANLKKPLESEKK
jgi:uncharacterized protein (DUF2062 family)